MQKADKIITVGHNLAETFSSKAEGIFREVSCYSKRL